MTKICRNSIKILVLLMPKLCQNAETAETAEMPKCRNAETVSAVSAVSAFRHFSISALCMSFGVSR